MSDDGSGLAGRVVGLLLWSYPRAFRKRYAAEMRELAMARLRRGAVRSGRARAWLQVSWDLVLGGLRERRGSGPPLRAGRTERRRNGREGTMKGAIGQNLTDAARRLVRTPLFSAAAVAIVALGLGANTAVFAIVDAVLLRPSPYPEADRLVRIYQDSDDGEPRSTSFPAYRDMAAATDVFEGVAAATPASLVWEAPAGPREVAVEFVTASLLPVLRLEPALGRWFTPSEDHPGAGNYAVVSHRTWTRDFGADPTVLGRTLRLGGHPVTVVGVGPEGFHGSGGFLVTDFWLSISSVAVGGSFRVANLDRRSDHWYDVQARLAPGVGLPRARAAMDDLAARLGETYPELNRGRDITVFGASAVRLHPQQDGRLYPVAAVLVGVVAMILLLACSNLANLLLVRGVTRSPEVAIRRALGASRGRVAGLFLTEALLLAAAGGAVGVLLARWILSFVEGLAPTLGVPGGLAFQLDVRVLAFTSALVVATGVLFGLAPALRSARFDLAGAMRGSAQGASPERGTTLLRNALVVVQVAISLVLLVGAGLLGRSLREVQAVEPGFAAEELAYVRVGSGASGLPAAEASLLLDGVRERIAGLPGVEAAAVGTSVPLGFGGTTTTVVEGWEPPSGTGSVELSFAVVDDAWFRALDIDVVAGRTFGPEDEADRVRSIVVTRAAADRFWGGDAVGRRVHPQGSPEAWRTVVGVVEDHTIRSLGESPVPVMYFSTRQASPGGGFIVARSAGGPPSGLVPGLRRAVAEAGSSLTLSAAGTFEERLGDSLRVPRLAAGALSAFSVLAALLATLGIYALVSFSVARRMREMGLRLALGAERGRVVRLVVSRMLAVVAVGAVLGLALAGVLMPSLEGALYGIGALDPVSFAAATAVLLAAAAVAAWLPARRAAGADPVAALRAQ